MSVQLSVVQGFPLVRAETGFYFADAGEFVDINDQRHWVEYNSWVSLKQASAAQLGINTPVNLSRPLDFQNRADLNSHGVGTNIVDLHNVWRKQCGDFDSDQRAQEERDKKRRQKPVPSSLPRARAAAQRRSAPSKPKKKPVAKPSKGKSPQQLNQPKKKSVAGPKITKAFCPKSGCTTVPGRTVKKGGLGNYEWFYDQLERKRK